MLKIYLIRHAESKLNKAKVVQGADKDSDLSNEGKEQAEKLVNRFKDKNIKAIYCSDLDRSFATAKILSRGLGVGIKKDPNLRELKIGDWANESNPLQKWIKHYGDEKAKGIPRETIRPPNGENSWDHMARVKKFLESIKDLEGEIIVVAHSGTNKVLTGIIRGIDPDEFYTSKQDNTCVNEIDFDGKNWVVKLINDMSHLD